MAFNGMEGLPVLHDTLTFNDKVAQHAETTQGRYPGGIHVSWLLEDRVLSEDRDGVFSSVFTRH